MTNNCPGFIIRLQKEQQRKTKSKINFSFSEKQVSKPLKQ